MMTLHYINMMRTPSVRAAEQANGSADLYARADGHVEADRLSAREIEFIGSRNSFYLATVSETGWPYIQHRGGPTGFVRALDDATLAFPDFRGNRQYLSLGNLSADNRAALFFMDYPNRRRLKLAAHIESVDIAADAALAEHLVMPDYHAIVERALLLHVESFDWNCPQHIEPRFASADVERALAPLRTELAQLRAENAHLRTALNLQEGK